jgi:hypothetical protein
MGIEENDDLFASNVGRVEPRRVAGEDPRWAEARRRLAGLATLDADELVEVIGAAWDCGLLVEAAWAVVAAGRAGERRLQVPLQRAALRHQQITGSLALFAAIGAADAQATHLTSAENTVCLKSDGHPIDGGHIAIY